MRPAIARAGPRRRPSPFRMLEYRAGRSGAEAAEHPGPRGGAMATRGWTA